MPLSRDIRTYADLAPLLDEALASPRGIGVKYETVGKAKHQRSRIYQFRVLDREANGASAYDPLNVEYVEYTDGTHWLKITHSQPAQVVRL